MKMSGILAAAAALLLLAAAPAPAQGELVWLTHKTTAPSKLVVSWTTKAAGDSKVRSGPTASYGKEAHAPGSRTLHHVEVPLTRGEPLHYSVSTGEQSSADASFRGYPKDVLRVAIVANWHAKPDLKGLLKDAPHLLLTAGDNVPDLWRACGVGVKDCVKPFAALIDRYPEMFRSTPFMPALGNHDREIRPRGMKPPAEAVYDV